MIGIGIALVVAAVILIIVGLAVHAVHILLWIGIVLIVIGAIIAIMNRAPRGPRVP